MLIFSYFIPFQADLPNLWKTFPLLIFGVVDLAAGILAFWLPEEMPQTVDYNLSVVKSLRSRVHAVVKKWQRKEKMQL